MVTILITIIMIMNMIMNMIMIMTMDIMAPSAVINYRPKAFSSQAAGLRLQAS